MYKYGLLDESQSKLDYVLAMTPQDFLERRLQTLVFKLGLAKSMHHARVLIRQRHIRCALQIFLADAALMGQQACHLQCVVRQLGQSSLSLEWIPASVHLLGRRAKRAIIRKLLAVCRVGKQIVNVPSFMVRVDSQKHIDFALNSPFGGGRPGRNKRKALK